jgi:hypothetical protein
MTEDVERGEKRIRPFSPPFFVLRWVRTKRVRAKGIPKASIESLLEESSYYKIVYDLKIVLITTQQTSQ